MPKTKLFVSHSSKDAAAEARRAELCQRLRDCGYDVLVDKRHIQSADTWREKINLMLAQCRAGVVLFNQHAIESEWVLKEATILNWRREQEDEFPLLTVLLDGVENNALKARGYSPLLLNEIQHTCGSIDDVVQAVQANVETDLEAPTIFDRLTDEVAGALGEVSSPVLVRVGSEAFDQAAFVAKNAAEVFAEFLAAHIITGGPDSVSRAVAVLEKLGGSLDVGIARRILKVVAPLWVEGDAAALIPEARVPASAFRHLALASDEFYNFTARMYVERAYPYTKRWLLADVDEAWGQDQVAYVQKRVRAAAARAMPTLQGDGAQIDARLNSLRIALIISLPEVPDDALLGELCGVYKQATYLMRTADRGNFRAALPPLARYIDPELDPTTESNAFNAHAEAELTLSNL